MRTSSTASASLPELHLELGRSTPLCCCRALLIGLVLLSVVMSAWPLWVRALLLSVLLPALPCSRWPGGPSVAGKPVALGCARGRWYLCLNPTERQPALLLPGPLLSSWLIAARFRVQGQAVRSILLWRGDIAADDWRRLRVALRCQ